MNRNKSISFGDKIFTRVTRNGRTILNFVSEKVANMADLVAQLRIAMKDVRGLVMLHIRNYNQGWGEERPLMLYARNTGESNAYGSFISVKSKISVTDKRPEQKSMFFPWETH